MELELVELPPELAELLRAEPHRIDEILQLISGFYNETEITIKGEIQCH